MTAVTVVYIFLKTYQLGEFLYSHFNIEDGRENQHFWHMMLYYVKKGKNATETQKKICAMYGEGAMTN